MYVRIPLDALSDRMLLPIDVKILGLLASHDNGAYCCWPTNKTLAHEAGCCVKTVSRALKQLQRLGWITLEPSSQVPRGQLIRLNWRCAIAPPDRTRGGGR